MSDQQYHQNLVSYGDLFGSHLGLDAQALADLKVIGTALESEFEQVVERFYQRLEKYPDLLAKFSGGASQLARQREALSLWVVDVFRGEMDQKFLATQNRIGSRHLEAEIDVPIMIAAMNWIRFELQQSVHEDRIAAKLELGQERCNAVIAMACDYSLGLMLRSYWTDLQSRMSQADRLALIARYTATINHELRNPLGVIGSSSYLIRRQEAGQDPEVLKHLDKIDRNVERTNTIISGMMNLIGAQRPDWQEVELLPFIKATLAGIERCAQNQITIEVGENERGAFDPNLVGQALEHLVRNARDASGAEAEIRVVVEFARASTIFRVLDQGPGFSPEIRSQVFEPLFSTKTYGTGLGLTLSKAVAEAHGGRLVIGPSQKGGGASVEIHIPTRVEF